jgi:hypothetical protein
VISSTNRAANQAVIVDLAYYRSCKKFSSNDHWRRDREFCVTFASYLRKRAGRVETDPDGLKRLAVAFDLRRVKLINSLTSMLDEQYLIDRANIALGLAEHLDDVLTIPTDQESSARATAYQLAHALDAVAAELQARLSSAHVTRQ